MTTKAGAFYTNAPFSYGIVFVSSSKHLSREAALLKQMLQTLLLVPKIILKVRHFDILTFQYFGDRR